MQELEVNLRLPDLWQQQAIRALQQGKDVVVDAPTGSGKTYIFEQVVQSGLVGNAIYTVPTRALANDKLLEWREEGWNVGIATGDIAENLGAPVIVATLETQKNLFLQGRGPELLVIDEYQMVGDPSRGVNYELVMAAAPKDTQMLLLSGSVGNPETVVEWMRRLGRDAVLISHKERPVPMEEVFAEALPDNLPAQVRGFWPRLIGRALKAGMGPILAFAPRRKAAESLARKLAAALPEDDPLVLTPEQKQLAGETLTRLLKARIAFHHSGLSYRQRAGLIEPLAKAGQLRVVVATMGLSSGINFSLRSVIVTDREYRAGDQHKLVRPDELLQMFGRAGRRGLDKRGYVIVAPGKPRLREARPLHLKRTNQVDWPSLLSVMQRAIEKGTDHRKAAQALATRLFSPQRVPLGLSDFKPHPKQRSKPSNSNYMPPVRQVVVEIQNSAGKWERRRAQRRAALGDTLVFEDGAWKPALTVPRVLTGIGVGGLCKFSETEEAATYGREIPLARMGVKPGEGELVLTRWLLKELRKHVKRRLFRKKWTLDALEKTVVPLMPHLAQGGEVVKLVERNGMINARVHYAKAQVFAHLDNERALLLDPPQREVEVDHAQAFRQAMGQVERPGTAVTPVEAWFQLGLVDAHACPTRRGILFSCFNHGEGLAIAAALEDTSYPVEELVYDLANLRAGHRFSEHEDFSSRLGATCRRAYKGASFPGYLNKGVPTDYGDGAAEIIQQLSSKGRQKHELITEELSSGDIERAKLEWRSLLNHCANAPHIAWDRWRDLQEAAREILRRLPDPVTVGDYPPLTSEQRQRHRSFLRFE